MMPIASLADRPVATLDITEASRRSWDCLVVGAGPAGAVAARQLALRGHSTLLVERARLPRWKACGCCLNHAALETLDRIGLRAPIESLAQSRLRRWRLATPYGHSECAMPTGLALSRASFDAALVSEALAAGSEYLDATTASVSHKIAEGWRVRLQTGNGRADVVASVLVAADGLKSPLLSKLGTFESEVQANSWIGAAATVHRGEGVFADLSPDTVYMTCGRDGYVGMVVLESDQIEIAAAVNPHALGRWGTVQALITEIVTEADGPCRDALAGIGFRGTPRLSRRRRRIAAERLFLIGDACGYTEPFTGEGMAWALTSGLLVGPLVAQAVRRWDPSLIPQWHSLYHQRIRKRQRLGRLLTRSLRYRSCTKIMTAVLNQQPRLAASVMRRINAPFDLQPVFAEVR